MEQQFDYHKENLLIVDDEIEIGKIVQDLLAKLGFNTGFASNGKNALEKVRNKDYTFLITDINIPKLNGIELIKIVKKIFTDSKLCKPLQKGADRVQNVIKIPHLFKSRV